MTDNLRAKVIRLAHSKPELRAALLPLLKQAAEPEVGTIALTFEVFDPGNFDSHEKRMLRNALLELVVKHKGSLKSLSLNAINKLYLGDFW